MLIEHRLGNACRVGDVVHRRAMEATLGKEADRGLDELLTSCGGGKSYGH